MLLCAGNWLFPAFSAGGGWIQRENHTRERIRNKPGVTSAGRNICLAAASFFVLGDIGEFRKVHWFSWIWDTLHYPRLLQPFLGHLQPQLFWELQPLEHFAAPAIPCPLYSGSTRTVLTTGTNF